jgi:uncharacterized protein (TIGR02271 family)
MTTTIVGLFDALPDAQAVAQEVRDTKLAAPAAIRLVARPVYSGTDDELRDLLVTVGAPPRTAAGYVAEVARGGTLVLVETDAAAVPTVVAVLQRHNLVDMHRRVHRAPTAPQVQASPAPRRARAGRPTRATRTAATPSRATIYPAPPDPAAEIAVPIVAEEVRIGTRQVDTGGIRVVTHVEAIPVEEQVTVRTEQVHIERRAVDRVVAPDDLTVLHDEAIEVRTTAEDVVVTKQARIVEEVIIRKDVEEHTETITDTVRRTAVEIEDLPGTSRGPSA